MVKKKYEYKNFTVRPSPEEEEEIAALMAHTGAKTKSGVCILSVKKYISHENTIEALEEQVRELKQEQRDMQKAMHNFVTGQKAITKFAKNYDQYGY